MIATLRRLFARPDPKPSLEDLARELDDKLAARKAERLRRANAARKGVSSHWQRLGQRTREMFNKEGTV